jgi:hypothetical protein
MPRFRSVPVTRIISIEEDASICICFICLPTLGIFDPLSSLTPVDAIIDNNNALPVQQSSLLDHLVSKAQQDIYVFYDNRQDISSIKNSVQFDKMKELQNKVEDTLNYLQVLILIEQ